MTKCFIRSKNIIALLLVLLGGGIPSQAYAGTPAENVRVLFLIDDSGSMADNDRTALRYTAIRLFVSALDEGDRVGVIRFATHSSLLLPTITTITNAQAKVDIIDSIQPILADGYTNMLEAFNLAESLMQESLDENSRSVVILLTDGKPEIEKPYASYESETIQAATRLGVPVYTIALTPYSQTSFLNQLTQETQGKVIPAQTAENLLDSYLQILGELKDRTVIKADQHAEDDSINIWLPPTLTPYISKVTFVASQPNHADIRLVNPDGTVVEEDHANVTFRVVDEHFVAITINTPPGGEWKFLFASEVPAQVHAILHSRLRVMLDSPGGLHPQGTPMLIIVSMYEEMEDGQVAKIIGEASFSAVIQLPDGKLESLDAFYDDGTHGDPVAGDGDYSRQYTNLEMQGTYQISIEGKKGVVPIQRNAMVEVIPFPEFQVQEPQNQSYDIRTTPIPLIIALQGEFQSELVEGVMQASVSAPSGNVDQVELAYADGYFTGTYLPQEEGPYTIVFSPTHLYYRGIEVTEAFQSQFTSRLIGKLVVKEAQVGIEEGNDLALMEVPKPGELIPVLIQVNSHTRHTTTIRVHLENLPGFILEDHSAIQIPPDTSYQQTIYLKSLADLQPGVWDGRLIFTTTDDVDLISPQIPLAFELITPTMVISPAVPAYSSSCQIRPTHSLTLTIHSTSLVEEKLPVKLTRLDTEKQEHSLLKVSPGSNTFTFEMDTHTSFFPYDQPLQVQIGPARPGLEIASDDSQVITIVVPGIWQTCRRPIIFLGLGLFGAIMMVTRMAKKIHQRTQPPVVTGTLIHWLAGTPEMEYQVNLTELNKTEVKIGRKSGCDVVLPDASVAEEHLTILAESGEAGEVRLTIKPIHPIMKGYQTHTSSIPLEEVATYQIGDCRFKFIADLDF